MLSIIVTTLIVVGVVISLVLTFKSSNWSQTSGVILKSEINTIARTRSSSSAGENLFDHEIVLEYEYQVDGNRFVGNKLYAALPNITSDRRVAIEISEKYSKGTEVTVFYNPKDPGKSCLENLKDISTGKKLFFIVLVFIVLSIFLVSFFYANKLLNS